MKLILQIALGVFIGMSVSQLAIDAWRTHRQEQVAQAEHARLEQLARERQRQAERIRELVGRKLQQQGAGTSVEPGPDSMPQEPGDGDDVMDPAPDQP